MAGSKNYEEYHRPPQLLVLKEEQLHKVCPNAPLELNHPFHLNHPLLLSKRPPRRYCFCHFCGLLCVVDSYAYDCSCGLVFHVKCAFFTFNIARNDFKDLQDPSIPDENDHPHKKCVWCWEPLAGYTCFSLDSEYNLHTKCVEHPRKLNHKCHRKHPLLLQFSNRELDCKICRKIEHETHRFVYACAPCNFAIHIDCVSPSPTIEHETHPHPFNLLFRQCSFICDACGTEGDHVAYTCGACSILVHKECISLPRFIKSKWHDHRVSHTYFLHRQYFTTLDCIICHDEVNTDYGSYSCKFCNVIFHAKCATKYEESYDIVSDDEDSHDESGNSFIVLERNDAGEATVIEHCEHIGCHLMLSDRARKYDNKCCHGCLLPISALFYHCSQCDFLLHKVCAELPKKKQVWYHSCQQPFVLISNKVFKCTLCDCTSNAFFYMCKECERYACLRCIIALTPGARTHPGHKHPLYFYTEHGGKCNACGNYVTDGLFRCKDCDFCLDYRCFSLPITAQHKSDEHGLLLTYHDDNSYSESHFCDTCEEHRDPSPWFYHCATCDTSTHVNCTIDRESSFIKIGSSFELEEYHLHTLTIVKMKYYYPNCSRCGWPCLDVALECGKPGCNYIIHFRCPKESMF